MKNNFEDFRATLKSFCEKALEGDIKLVTFWNEWPKELSKTELVLELFEDLEDGITHFPGFLLSGKKDFESWRGSDMEHRIRIDLQLLASGLHEKHIFLLRKIILDKNIRDKDHIKELIDAQVFTPDNS